MFGEYERVIRRLVEGTPRILQADKCLIMLHDPAAHILYAIPPALGLTATQLSRLKSVPIQGMSVSAEVFRDEKPVILSDARLDSRAGGEGLTDMGVQNGLSVPLITETRDLDSRLLERRTVGVLHVFNKWHGGVFIDEDVRLLQRIAVQLAALVTAR